MTLGFVTDGLLYSRHRIPSGARVIGTDGGDVHVRTSGDPAAPAIVLVPDGPFVVEHYDSLIARLSRDYFTVCFDLPGFGYSLPRVGYDHSFDAVVRVLEQVLDSLSLGRVTLAFTCANGFYALAFAARRPERVEQLVLGQTPSFEAMMGWAERVVPKPIRVPVVGQLINYAGRRALPGKWFGTIAATVRPTRRVCFRSCRTRASFGSPSPGIALTSRTRTHSLRRSARLSSMPSRGCANYGECCSRRTH
jgi:pimeloyl-ACP methyl ester carboxylesterase